MSMTLVDEKEILEVEKLKQEIRESNDKRDLEISKLKKEIHHMTFKEWSMVAAFFTALGAIIAKVI